jgi:dipeptidyl aminopeptidase/acylaminoacyl peptidase
MRNLRFVAGLLAVWVLAGVAGVGQGTQKRAMTFADLMAMKRVSDPQVSPSGKWVMFSVTDVSLEKNSKVNHLWVVGLGGGEAAQVSNPTIGAGQPAPIMGHPSGERQVTFGDGESNGRFSPDGRWVSYSAKDQVYVAAWDEAAGTVGAVRELTRVEGGADGAEWSPDSKRLMFVASVWPECSVKGGMVPGDGQKGEQVPFGNDNQKRVDAPNFVVGGTRDLSGASPTHRGETAMNGAPSFVVGGTRDLSGASPTHRGETAMNGAPGFVVGGTRDLSGASPTHRGETAMNGAPSFVVGGTRDLSGASPTHRGETVMNGAPSFVVGGTREVLNPTRDGGAVTNGAPAVSAGWAEEDDCDKAKDEAAEKSPVKGQVWEGLLYRHWDHYTGAKRSHVLVVNVDGTGVRDLTPATVVGDAETPTFSLGGPLGYAWAPDSKEIAYVTNLDKVPAASTNNDVFTLRLDEAGAKAVKVSTSPGSDDGPAYSPDGKWLAFRSQARGGFEADKFRLMLMDREAKTIKDLMPKFDNWVDEFVWEPSSKGIFFASGDAGRTLVASVDVEGGGKYKPLFGGDEMYQIVANYAEISDLQLSRDGKTLVVSEMHIDKPTSIVASDLTRSEMAQQVQWPTSVQKNLDDRKSFSISRGLASPNTWVPRRVLTPINNTLLDQLSLSKLETFKFAGADGTPVEGFLLKPPGFDPAKKYPVKFLMHGGPQTAWGDAWSFRWNWELMAANGYVVIGVNRRGSTGYGQKFVDEVSGDWGGRAYEDLMKGLDYAEGHYSFIDKTRECALGASYGGFMANWVLTHTNRFKCIVTHDGMYDPVSAYGTTEELWFNEWEFRRPEDFPKGWDGFGAGYDPMGRRTKTNAVVSPLRPAASGRDDGVKGPAGPEAGPTHRDETAMNGARSVERDGRPAQPWRYAGLAADQDPFRKWSPMLHIQDAKTPTLVIHSQKDMRLDVSQGMELFTALQRLGVPSKMLYFPDEGHWILKPQNAEVWNEVVGDWCDRWTKTGKYAEK